MLPGDTLGLVEPKPHVIDNSATIKCVPPLWRPLLYLCVDATDHELAYPGATHLFVETLGTILTHLGIVLIVTYP